MVQRAKTGWKIGCGKRLAFIADEIEPLLHFYETLAAVRPEEIATLKEIIKRREQFKSGKFTELDMRLFWGYNNRWRRNQMPLDPNAPETVPAFSRFHGGLGVN